MQDQQSSRNLQPLINGVSKVMKLPIKNDKLMKQKLLMQLDKLQEQQSTRHISHTKQSQQFSVGIICIICSSYLLKSVQCCCGHCFCQLCLQQYFLFSHLCPSCQYPIRSSPYNPNNSLNQFVEIFIRQNDKQYVIKYQQRLKQYKQYRDRRKLSRYFAGMKIDVRDQNLVWLQGIVNRLISRVGQPIKYLRIEFLDQNAQIKMQDFKANSTMLADFGFFTQRKQLPKYKHTKTVYKR